MLVHVDNDLDGRVVATEPADTTDNEGASKARKAASGFVAADMVLLAEGLWDEARGTGAIGLRQPCTIEGTMGMSFQCHPKGGAASRLPQAVGAWGGVPLALQELVGE